MPQWRNLSIGQQVWAPGPHAEPSSSSELEATVVSPAPLSRKHLTAPQLGANPENLRAPNLSTSQPAYHPRPFWSHLKEQHVSYYSDCHGHWCLCKFNTCLPTLRWVLIFTNKICLSCLYHYSYVTLWYFLWYKISNIAVHRFLKLLSCLECYCCWKAKIHLVFTVRVCETKQNLSGNVNTPKSSGFPTLSSKTMQTFKMSWIINRPLYK